MAKIQIRVSIDEELVREARGLGLDLPKTCELAIERKVAALKSLNEFKDLEGG